MEDPEIKQLLERTFEALQRLEQMKEQAKQLAEESRVLIRKLQTLEPDNPPDELEN